LEKVGAVVFGTIIGMAELQSSLEEGLMHKNLSEDVHMGPRVRQILRYITNSQVRGNCQPGHVWRMLVEEKAVADEPCWLLIRKKHVTGYKSKRQSLCKADK